MKWVLRERQMCGVWDILHELDAQQCHTRTKLECGVAGLTTSGEWLHTPHTFVFFFYGLFHFHPLNIINWSFIWIGKIKPYGHKSIQHGHVVCLTYHIMHIKCYIMWYATNLGIIQQTFMQFCNKHNWKIVLDTLGNEMY